MLRKTIAEIYYSLVEISSKQLKTRKNTIGYSVWLTDIKPDVDLKPFLW